MKLEIEELELLMGPEGLEVNLRYILMNASRRGSRIFEIFSTKEKREAPETEGGAGAGREVTKGRAR